MKGKKELVTLARKIGAGENGRAIELFSNAQQWLSRTLLARPDASLTVNRQAAFLVWLSGVLFDKRSFDRCALLHDWGIHCLLEDGKPHHAVRAQRLALSICRRERGTGSSMAATLMQLAMALDETGRRYRATRLLEIACRLCEIHQVEPTIADCCLRLSAAAHAWRGDLNTTLDRMDQAATLSDTVYGATALQAVIGWATATCHEALHMEDTPYTLRMALMAALHGMSTEREPSELFLHVSGLVIALDRTLSGNLAVVSAHTAVWAAREAPEYVTGADDRGILFNNYGNALLGAGLDQRASVAFGETIQLAGDNQDPDQQADADYQSLHAHGGMGLAFFNIGNRAEAYADQQEAYRIAAAWFAKAAQLCRRIGSKAWFEGRVWVCAGMTEASLGQTEQAWFYFAWGLLAGFSHWGTRSDAGALEGFLNPDSDIRLKMVEGFEQLNARHAAVLFCKAAVHAVYREAFPGDFPSSAGSTMYLRSRSHMHRKLAQGLTFAGRYNEAEQAFALLKDDAWGVYTRREGVPPEIEAAVAITKAEAAALNRSGIPALLASISSVDHLNEATIARMGVLLSELDKALETEVRLRKDRQLEAQDSLSVQALIPGDARIRYLVSDGYVTITVQVGDTTTTHRVDTSFQEISLLAFAFRRSHAMEESGFLSMSSALYRILIEPLTDTLKGITHLWIEADSPLDGVPFATLFDGKAYVFERFSTAYLNTAANGKLPVAQHAGPTVTVFACSELLGAHLPGAALEREAIQEVLASSPQPRSLSAYSHEDCTTERLLDHLCRSGKGSSALHLATHAAFNATSDMLSILALADGSLSISRLRNAMASNAPDLGLFVLSACGTARQDLDVEGFSLTLLRAGVGSVVSSLWETLDESAPAFFKVFYEACDTFESPRAIAGALQQAQIRLSQHYREMSLRTEQSQAAHWAPYVVVTGRIG